MERYSHQQKQQHFVVNKAFQSLSFKKNYLIQLNKHNIKWHKPRAYTYGAILVTTKNDRTLYALVQGRYTGKWSFPKGHSNEGEKPIECTMREVAEETGITSLPEPTDYIKIGYGNYYVFILEEPYQLVPRDTHEIMDTKWVTLEEMEHMSLNADASMYRKQLSTCPNP